MPMRKVKPSLHPIAKNGVVIRVLAPEFAILEHVLFPKNLEGADVGVLQFREQIEECHTFVLELLADTIWILCIAKTTLSTHFECCVSPLQIWFLKHLVACNPLTTKGLVQEDLIWAHFMTREHLKQRGLGPVLRKLKIGSTMLEAQLASYWRSSNQWCRWKTIAINGVPRYEGVLLDEGVWQLGWSKTFQLPIKCVDVSSKTNLVISNEPSSPDSIDGKLENPHYMNWSKFSILPMSTRRRSGYLRSRLVLF